MTFIEKNIGYIALITTVLAFGGTVETFTNVGPIAKLIVVAIAGLSVLLYCARELASYVKPEPAMPGFGSSAQRLRIRSYAVPCIVLAVAAMIGIALAVFVSLRFAAHFSETVDAKRSIAVLTAAYAKVDKIIVQLPAHSQSKCKYSTSRERPELKMIDFDSPNPKFQIDNFYYPQSLTITCEPGAAVVPFVEPTTAAFYRADQMDLLRIGIYSIGGVIWIIACLRFLVLLRR